MVLLRLCDRETVLYTLCDVLEAEEVPSSRIHTAAPRGGIAEGLQDKDDECMQSDDDHSTANQILAEQV
jgi:hypothetical protein